MSTVSQPVRSFRWRLRNTCGSRHWGGCAAGGASTASPGRLSGEVGSRMEERSGEIPPGLREREEMPEGAVSLPVSPGGVMMRMNAGATDGKPADAGWRTAACGVVALSAAGVEVPESRYFGCLPEAGRTGLKSRLKAEAPHWLERGPDLRPAAVADGAKDNRTFLESPGPDVMLSDFWHGAQHPGAAANAAFGPDTDAGTAWSGKWRHVMRHDPKGAGKVTGALRHLPPKGKGTDDVRRELAFLRGNRRRMHHAAAGHPIGSGSVESANKVLLTSRMKRPGQGRGRDGDWKPPECANENRPAARTALAA